jgi:hypothetical protein
VAVKEPSKDTFHENINVAIGRLPQPFEATEYARISLDIMKKAFKSFKLQRQGDTRVGRVDAHWFEFSYQNGAISIKVLQYLLVSGKLGYAITCSSSPEQFHHLRPLFEKMSESFRLEAPQIADKK